MTAGPINANSRCPRWCDPRHCTIDVANIGGCHMSTPIRVCADDGSRVAEVCVRQFRTGRARVAYAMRGQELEPAVAVRFSAALDEAARLLGVARPR